MLPTWIGGTVFALGVLCQFCRLPFAVAVMLALTVFGASSAIDLPALGGASVAPANLFLVFYALRFARETNALAGLRAQIDPRSPLFIFLLLLCWIVISALLLPRLFDGEVDVFSLSRSADNDGSVTPLHPSGGNLSQAVYAIGGFCCAWFTAAYVRRLGPDAIISAILIATGLHILFALLDAATSATGTGFLLDPIHNGGYAFLTEDELGGLKRISGSFSETSSFAAFSNALLAVNFTFFLMKVRPVVTGVFSFLIACFLLLATSSSGYVGLAALVGIFFLHAVVEALRGRHGMLAMAVAIGVAALAAASVVLIFLPSVADVAQTVFDQSLLSKSTSDSAIERGAMNEQSWRVFLDTRGLGAGVGSERASNYLLVLLSNLGVPGLLLFLVFLAALTTRRLASDMSVRAVAVTAAARLGLLAILIPSLLTGTVYDLGALFYCLIGVAAASSTFNERSRLGLVPAVCA